MCGCLIKISTCNFIPNPFVFQTSEQECIMYHLIYWVLSIYLSPTLSFSFFLSFTALLSVLFTLTTIIRTMIYSRTIRKNEMRMEKGGSGSIWTKKPLHTNKKINSTHAKTYTNIFHCMCVPYRICIMLAYSICIYDTNMQILT